MSKSDQPDQPKSPTDVVREHRDLFETIAGLDEDEADEQIVEFAERFGKQPLAALEAEDEDDE